MLITDQCPSLKQAIPKVYPNVKHRLCMWHICNKFADKLGSNLAKTGILKQLNDIVWDDQLSVTAFESEWSSIMDQYDLQSHDWLKRMYNLREEWIPAFFGEMITSMIKCMSTSVVQTDELSTFSIKDLGLKAPQHTNFKVSYNKSDGSILCSCNRYVLHGTLCRHFFYVFRMFGIDEFPKKYVLTRWLKDVATQMNPNKRANRNKMLGGGYELNSMVRDIYGIVDVCVDQLVTNMEDLSLYKDKQEELKKDVETNTSVMPPMSNREVIASYYGVTSNEEITLKTPKGIRNK
ncbi:hypothetical protein LXL04_033967 [Taraxacum kok-saghyz]